jgi:hypothetical protein
VIEPAEVSMPNSPSTLSIVRLKTRKAQADECLVEGLMSLVERAKRGEIHRMVCVCMAEDSSVAHNVRHRAHDLGLVGAVSIILADMQREWTVA